MSPSTIFLLVNLKSIQLDTYSNKLKTGIKESVTRFSGYQKFDDAAVSFHNKKFTLFRDMTWYKMETIV